MTGTFLRAIDISSGPMELMGENETPKGFFLQQNNLRNPHRSVFLGVEKCTKADEGIYRFEKRKHFAVWKSNKHVIWHQVCYLK